MGGQPCGVQPLREWTVAFAHDGHFMVATVQRP